MAGHPTSTFFRRNSILAFAAIVALSTTGCQERTRLASEIQELRRQTLKLQPEFVQAQADLNSANKTYQSLRVHPVVKNGGPDNLSKEVQTLIERKDFLEAEVADLRKELEAYRQLAAAPLSASTAPPTR